MDYGRDDVSSACGLAISGGSLYSACNIADTSYLAIFDGKTLAISQFLPLDHVRDVHSIAIDGNAIYLVSTGTDEIVRAPLADPNAGETVWRASSTLSDTHHLNSIALSNGRVLCTGFGPKRGERWSSADDGYVYDVTSGSYVARGLYHPHSLTIVDNQLYVCESARGLLRGGEMPTFPGYLRGLCFSPGGEKAVATSVGRWDSEAEIFLNPADPGVPAGGCALYVATGATWDDAMTIDLAHLSNEVYDVIAWHDAQ